MEDEATSLAREVNGSSLQQKSRDDVQNRGDIDQWPIIQDLEPVNDVQVASSDATSALSSFSGYETGTTSFTSETPEPRGRHPSVTSLLDLPEVPDLSRRQPSPYVYAPKVPRAVHVVDDSAYSSPEAKVVESRRTELPLRSNVLKEIEQNKRSMSTASSRGPSEDIEAVETSERKPSRYSITGQGLGERDRRTSPWQSINSMSLLNEDHTVHGTRNRGSSVSNSRTSPSYSPNLKASRPPRNTPPQSGYSSGSQSTSNSRPVSPSLGYARRSSESPRGSRSFASSIASQSTPGYSSSRLATASFPPVDYHTAGPVNVPDVPKNPRTSHGGSVPYPTEPISMMPSEHHFRIRHSDDIDSYPHVSPSLKTHQTYPTMPIEHRIPTHHRTGSSSFAVPLAANVALTRLQSSQPLLPPNLPPCYRQQPSYHTDWLTFRDSPYILICPTCFASTFNTSIDFRDHCMPASPQCAHQALSCALSSPWVRLALLQTHNTQSNLDNYPDLRLLYQVSHLSTTRSCPGEDKARGQWYTLRHNGHRISGFNVCAGCVSRVEALVPALRAQWEESKSSGKERRCMLWDKGRRWTVFMDELIESGWKAEERGRPIKLSGLVDLVEG